jgi:hypothetical protein
MRKRKDRPSRPNATGRSSSSGQFVMLPHRILKSEAYASLDPIARAALTELVMLYNGENNGSLWLSVRDLTERLGMSDYRPAMRALDDLRDRGLTTIAKDAHFEVKAADSSRARCWRLTWHVWAECPIKSKRAPTNEWERYVAPAKTPARKRADRRLRALARYRKDEAAGRFPVVDSTTLEAQMPKTEAERLGKPQPPNPKSDAIPRLVAVGDSTAHLHGTRGSTLLAWWQPDWSHATSAWVYAVALSAQATRSKAKRAA